MYPDDNYPGGHGNDPYEAVTRENMEPIEREREEEEVDKYE